MELEALKIVLKNYPEPPNFASANAEVTIRDIKNAYEMLILNRYNIFIGCANTIKSVKEALKSANIEIDGENNLFLIDNRAENGRIIEVKDKELKKELLRKQGLFKDL